MYCSYYMFLLKGGGATELFVCSIKSRHWIWLLKHNSVNSFFYSDWLNPFADRDGVGRSNGKIQKKRNYGFWQTLSYLKLVGSQLCYALSQKWCVLSHQMGMAEFKIWGGRTVFFRSNPVTVGAEQVELGLRAGDSPILKIGQGLAICAASQVFLSSMSTIM